MMGTSGGGKKGCNDVTIRDEEERTEERTKGTSACW